MTSKRETVTKTIHAKLIKKKKSILNQNKFQFISNIEDENEDNYIILIFFFRLLINIHFHLFSLKENFVYIYFKIISNLIFINQQMTYVLFYR